VVAEADQPPGVIGVANPDDLLVGQDTFGPVDQMAKPTGVDDNTWPARSGALSIAKNHRHTGMPVLRKSCAGSATMHDTRSASTMARAESRVPRWCLTTSETVGHHHTPALAAGRQLRQDVLDPGVVGVARGRYPEAPAGGRVRRAPNP